MPSTIRDVARQAGVGVGTVSRVLNGNTAVSETTRHRVQTAIEELNYVPNSMARRLSLGRTMTVGILAPFFTRPSVIERLRGIEAIFGHTQYDISLFNVETMSRRESCFRDIFRRERVDGLLVITLVPTEEEIKRLQKANIPTVLVDAYAPAFHSIGIDDVYGGQLATNHLLALGHRRIGFISHYRQDDFGNGSSQDRFVGYRQALQAAEIPFRADYVRESEADREAAYSMATELLTLEERPTAIFAASDAQAIGILKAAQALNLAVPRDLSVIGYDDIELAEYINLTTIHQPLMQSGRQGAELLLHVMQGMDDNDKNEAADADVPHQVRLPIHIVSRGTTAVVPTI